MDFQFSIFNFQKKDRGGFTLLEILITISILAVIAVVTFSTFIAFRDTANLDTVAEQGLSLVIDARSRTISSKDASQYGVHFETSQIVLFKGPAYSASDPNNEVVALLPDIEISEISLQGGGGDVVFKRLTGDTDQYGTVTFQLTSNSTEKRILTILATGIARIGAADPIPSGNLVAYWKFDEASGTTATDASGNDNHGTLINMEEGDWTTGKIGNALEFNTPTTDQKEYVTVPGSSSLDITDDITITLWVRPSIDSTAFHNSWNFFIYHRSSLKYEIGYYNDGGPRFKPYNQSGSNFDFSPDVEFASGTWYHVAMVRRGSSLEIYINGILSDSRNDFATTLRAGGNEVRIGGNGGSGGFWGAIDDVRIYSRALTQSEVAILANM